MVKLVVSFVAVVSLAAWAAPAGAWSVADTETAVRVADAHWPLSPCHGLEVIQWMRGGVLAPEDDTIAVSTPDECLVQVAWDRQARSRPSADFLCGMLEHEYGHLAGYWDSVGVRADDGTVDHSHSPNQDSVMFPDEDAVPQDCAVAFPARRMCHYLPRTGTYWARPAVANACSRPDANVFFHVFGRQRAGD